MQTSRFTISFVANTEVTITNDGKNLNNRILLRKLLFKIDRTNLMIHVCFKNLNKPIGG